MTAPSFTPKQLGANSSSKVEGELQEFARKTAPELASRIERLDQALRDAENKRAELEQLASEFPSQAAEVQKALVRWRQLEQDLWAARQEISRKLEIAYAKYIIDEVQGREAFSASKQELLRLADQALTKADQLRSGVDSSIAH